MKEGFRLNVLNRLKENFSEVEQALSKQEAVEESNRCLYCYDAPCITACPTGIDIPSFIQKISSDNVYGSARTIMEANPVGASCARVCPTEELCEGACVLNHSTTPIMIGKLQRYATDWAKHNEKVLFKRGKPIDRSIGIIGGGPAGLSCARELAVQGYSVTIYEANEEAGGLDTYGIVSFRLPKAVSRWEVEQVEELGVEIQTNCKVGVDVSFDEIQSKHDSIVLAIGMGEVPNLHLPGETLEGVHDAIQLVKSTKKDDLPEPLVGKAGVVIGAGNTAIDGATCAVRLGAEQVQILYRRTSEEMTAYDFEYEFAKQDGVEFRWLTMPVHIHGNDEGKVTSIECMKMELQEPGEDGRRRVQPIEGSNFTIEVDFVIKAIGQNRYLELLNEIGVDHVNGVVRVEEGRFKTSLNDVYACGDVTFGEGHGEAMVVTAAEQGKQTAYRIHEHLQGQARTFA
ncbi:dihydropyrimidine dehydrogenase [Bacillaceae bacterium JMAK1]|nr:dihydropyrimidine dehydrogenase [Bacillaceae bacterium JMAK1]